MITEDKIFAKIKELDSNGVMLTQKAVRDALGGGSFTTINAALKKYREEQDSVEQAPDAFFNKFVENVDALFAVALHEAEKRFHDEKASMRVQMQEIQAELSVALDEIVELEKLAAEVDDLQNALEEAEKKTQELVLSHHADTKKFTSEISALEAKLTESAMALEIERASKAQLMSVIEALKPKVAE